MAFRKGGAAARGYDFVVIGAGPAGCAVAARLSRLAGCRVLLLEAGGFGRNPALRIPAAAPLTMRTSRYAWRYDTEPDPLVGAHPSGLIAGRMIGGGSSINGMMYLRGQPADYDRWRDEAGCPGWGYTDVLPFFRKSEASDRGASLLHGDSGPIGTSKGHSSLPITAAFLDACERNGLAVADDLNALTGEGSGLYDRMIRNGRRSTARDYLDHIADSRQLSVIIGAHVTGIDIVHGRARAVRYVKDGKSHRVEAAQEIVLTAGCVNTTQLLLLSGIGPADDLARHGIAVHVHAPEVGANLQNHAAATLQFAFDAGMTAIDRVRGMGMLTAGAQYLKYRGGLLSELPTPAGALLCADEGSSGKVPDTQIILGVGLPGRGSGWRALLSHVPGFMLMVNQGRPASRGNIRLRSNDPFVPPVIENGFFREPRDRTILADAVLRTRALVETGLSGANGATPILLSSFAKDHDHATLASVIHQHAGAYYHMAGTGRMGTDSGAVVDPALRVRGIGGLRIADTSIAPLLVNGNTTAMALMIGERAAELLAGG
ncbi:GMC family oxidoreductase [Sphingobium sp. EM0848]|uniref:GMC family oxidoreductase n=1 Tax=Sphingobium sp. EM0848 TaxID=2743473 RepID=UPI00159C8F29|nr:GMC family oxidoreductase N-terminal domain-containing protein [Sphingobium sp. EM0848]